MFVHSLLPPPPPPSPLPSHFNTSNLTSQPGHKCLPSVEGCGLQHRLSSSEARMQPQPSLPFLKGCGRLSFIRQRIQGGRSKRGTHGVLSPSGELRNMSHDICHGSFSCSIFLSPSLTPLPRTKQYPEITTMRATR